MARWLRCEHEGQPRLGRVDGDEVLLHEGLPWATPVATGERVPLATLAWLAPCEPRQIVGLWNNFRAAAQKNGWAEPAEPLYFLKSPHCTSGHQGQVPAAPAEVGRVAFEGELALVIGRPTHRIDREEAAGSIFGYTLANDLTAIELLQRDSSFAQWSRAKSLPGFAALGPWIDTGFVPAGRRLQTRVGGRERQHYELDDMVFAPEEIVFRLAQDLLLMPGDVVLCGTSLGVLPMKPGSDVEIEVEGLGLLRQRYG
jgi:2-keto-4-pentenoate hydratase/2-oxohepta-3-ene-1,7-dioic acid hydratase in catechol pathway